MSSPEAKDKIHLMPIPDAWVGLSGEEAATEALRPLRSLALVLGDDRANEVDALDTSRVIMALVQRAEVILGIPDGSI
jgi:hypothetical protein